MEILQTICQLVVGLGILNVWLLRFKKKTPYRGGEASSIKEEFSVYGLPELLFWVIGTVKISAALALLIGIALPTLVLPAAVVLAVLMLGAIIMHVKVKDPAIKSLPATGIFVLTLFLIFIQSNPQI
mgnify:CR=1 FL=1